MAVAGARPRLETFGTKCYDLFGQARKEGRDVADDAVLVPHFHPNQLRHAKATEVTLSAAYDGRTLVISIRDDGCGFAEGVVSW